MPFPTRGEIDAFHRYMYQRNLEELLRKRHPDLDRIIPCESEPGMFLRAAVGEHSSVICGQSRVDTMTGPVIVSPRADDAPPRFWLVEDDEIVEAFYQITMAARAGRRTPSPWCWGEPLRTPLVELADQLTGHGLEPIAVVARNRTWTDVLDGRNELEFVDDAAGEFLLLDCGEGRLRISLQPDTGWLADFHHGAYTHSRIDLRTALNEVPGVRPGVPLHELPPARLATLVSQLLREKTWRQQPRLSWQTTSHDELEPARLLDIAGQWLRGLGFTDVLTGPGPDLALSSNSFHVVYHRKRAQVTLSQAKQMFADATLAGLPLMCVSPTGYSKPACAFVDKANVLAFGQYLTTGTLRALSTVAARIYFSHGSFDYQSVAA
jgi:hypothetical protein